MAEKGIFTWSNTSAELTYDVQNSIAYIENFDKQGHDFLRRLHVGDQVQLMKSNELIKFVLLDLTEDSGQIKFKVQLVKP
jgi:hypothetical protein